MHVNLDLNLETWYQEMYVNHIGSREETSGVTGLFFTRFKVSLAR